MTTSCQLMNRWQCLHFLVLSLPSGPHPIVGRTWSRCDVLMASWVNMLTQSHEALALPALPQMQLETEKERVSLLETLLQTQRELADASQQLERLRQDMKIQKLKEQVWKMVLRLILLLLPPKWREYRCGP